MGVKVTWYSHACLSIDVDGTRLRSGETVIDAAVDYAQNIPVNVIGRMLGFPEKDEDLFREFVHTTLERINEALNIDEDAHRKARDRQELADKLSTLSEREKQVFDRVADGQMNKVIAADLGISERTVEVHRGQVMKKLDVRTLAQLVRVKIDMEHSAAA